MRTITLITALMLTLAMVTAERLWAVEPPTDAKSKAEAIIVLSTVTIDEMHSAKSALQNNGVSIQLVFPPSVFIADVPRHLAEAIKQLDFVDELSYVKLAPDNFKDYEASALDGIKFWNAHLDEQSGNRAAKQGLEAKKQAQGPFRDRLLIPTDLPKTPEERIRKNRQYAQHWQAQKAKIDRQERIKKNNWQKRHPGKNKNQSRAGLLMLPASENSGAAAALPGFRAYGAGVTDTSLYMAGDISVGVVFVQGQSAWSDEGKTQVYNGVVSLLNKLSRGEPNAQITFYPVKEEGIPQAGDPPKALDLTPEKEDTAACREYLNDLRNKHRTHWAYLILVDPALPSQYAYYNGPLTRLFSFSGMVSSAAARHETMHIFGALDQYRDAAQNPINRAGYLAVVNANSQYNSGKGFFSGAGEGQADIMIDSGPIGVYSRGQIGWRDSNGNGILDPLDTFPYTGGLTRSGNNPYTYTGKAVDKALLNAGEGGDVTLNTISRVEYRINGLAWCLAAPADGRFDSAEEGFSFTLPALKNGRYSVETRAINSVGNSESSYAKDTFTVSASQVTNVRPFAAFSISPPEGSINTEFIFDASESGDLEDPSSLIYVRWDFENDGIWDTGFSTTKRASFRYADTGVKTVVLEVRDKKNSRHLVTKQVKVAPDDPNPHLCLLATPENYHGDSALKFKVTLDARGSYAHGRDPGLKIRWDFQGDGVWDTEYSDNLFREHCYQLPLANTIDPIGSCDTPGDANSVFVSGNFAYVADGQAGLQIIDISNPRAPLLAGSYDTPGNANSVFVLGNYAYVADGDSGLQIINIRNRQAPVLVASYDTPGSAHNVYVYSGIAYVADGKAGLQLIFIGNPRTPVLLGSYKTMSYAYGVFVLGNYAYVADGQAGLRVIDISNPRAPVFRGHYSIWDNAYYGVYVLGNYAYAADGQAGLRVIDISNPRVPLLAGGYDTPGLANSVFVSGNFAYAADGQAGLQVIDISNPRAPLLAGSYDTPGNANSVFVSGNFAYVADGKAGLQVIDVSLDTLANFKAGPKSSLWKIKAEIIDRSGKTSQASRDIWAVTYNHPPKILNLISTKNNARIDYVVDPDRWQSWDGLLEYRWDLDNDGTWDTRFSSVGEIINSFVPNAAKFACQVRDRFGATDTKVADWPDILAPATAISYLPAYSPGSWINRAITVALSATDANGSGVKEVLYSLDGSAPALKYASPIALNKDGIYNLRYCAVDNAENREDTQSAEIKIDLTGPVVIPALTVVRVPAGKAAIINTTITDSGSGVKAGLAAWHVRQLNGEQEVWVRKGIIPLKAAGKNDIYSWVAPGMPKNTAVKYVILATDQAGNNTLSREYYIIFT